MCLAVEEMRRDWKAEGRAEGEAKGIVELGTELGLSEQEILSRLQSRLHVPVQKAQEYLRAFGQITV